MRWVVFGFGVGERWICIYIYVCVGNGHFISVIWGMMV